MSYGRGSRSVDGMVSLKVDNLTYQTTPDDLRRVFEKYGEVGDVYIPRDRFSRESRGFAFVRFYDKRDAEDAMDAMDGAMLDGRELRCQMARYGRPAEPYRRSPARRYGRGRYRSDSRSRSRSHSRRERRRSRSYSSSKSRSASASPSHSDPQRSKHRSRDDEKFHSKSRSASKSPAHSPPKSEAST